jgi:hypothetical protein
MNKDFELKKKGYKYECWDMDCFDRDDKFKCKGDIESEKCQFHAEFKYLNNKIKSGEFSGL